MATEITKQSNTTYSNAATVTSNVAMVVTGMAAFTTTAPILTGVLATGALVSSVASTYLHYRSQETDKSEKLAPNK